MKRLFTLFVFFLFTVFAILIKLFYIQAFSGDTYSGNYLRTTRIAPVRGIIFDRNKEPLVINQSSYTLFAEPKNLEDSFNTLKEIDSILNIGEATLEGRFDKSKDWVALARNLEEDQKKKLEKLNIHGLGFDEYSKRYYPEASIAAHLDGFVGKDEDGDDIGYFGVEGYYDKDLQGLPGLLKTERDILGRPIVIGTQNKLKGENGRDFVLTIDKRTQKMAKEAIEKAIEVYKAQSGCITIIEPNTGEILAMDCAPDFDPSEYFKFNESFFKNPVISDVFEPGSIIKPLWVAAALNEQKIKSYDMYDEKGPINIGKYYIRTWDNKYHGDISITQILQQSSNVGMVFVGDKLGEENIKKYLKAYGFGEKTNIDLQGEVSSYLRKDSQWRPIDFATVTFGQGIVVTQIQMLKAFSVLVNGGWVVEPHVVKEMVSESGDAKKIAPKKEKRILTEKTSRTIRQMLYETVNHGEAKWNIPKGYKIGGKTGTAQIAIQGAYDASKTNASFIGFGPVDNPKFLVLVTLNQPQTSPWASETSAPVFFEVARDLLVQYNIPPK